MSLLVSDFGRRHPELPDAVAGTRPEKEGLTMSMKERLKIHRQIEAENKDSQERWHRRQIVKEFYPLFCREGRFCEARLLLKLLRNGTITLGLDDESSSIEHLLENIGFKAFYGRNYNTARYTL